MNKAGKTTVFVAFIMLAACVFACAFYPGKALAAQTQQTLKAPRLLFADRAAARKVSVRWKQVKGASGYYVYKSLKKGGPYKRVAVNAGATNLRAIATQAKGKAGYYKIRAYKTVDGKKVKSPYSNIVKCVKYRNSNLGYLFPSGPPSSEAEMRTYLVTVKLKVRTAGGGTGYIHLPIHRKLTKEVKACFDEMYKMGFKVRAGDTGSYNWRMMRTVNLMSHHSYGCVVDLNWQSNPMVQLSQIGSCAYRPGKDSYSITRDVVNIWKKHGFSWGGDWTEKKDYMHLTYTNN